MVSMVRFNIGWMTHYRGDKRSDRIINGGKYVVQHETGGEVENFLPRSGRYRGYVQLPGSTLKLEHIGGSPDAPFVDGTTVVFSATRPGGGGYVVGWYRNARVWREYQPQHPHGFITEAKVEESRLLAVDDRVLVVPRGRSGSFVLGQSNVRYLHEANARPFVRDLRQYIQRDGNPRPAPRRGRRQPDAALRKRIETVAVQHVVKHYEKLGFMCCSVEQDNVGWDLVCVREGLELLVEVKGCSGDAQVELTPNEYAAMTSRRHRDRYRLAVVSTVPISQSSSTTSVMTRGATSTNAWQGCAKGWVYGSGFTPTRRSHTRANPFPSTAACELPLGT
ncbi:MAG: DUF3883 domain-containing protein [Gammaproteobacteria bacterium]|nr:DUF3883 domain-containing protein [Gammaproteobacteria bacterium]